MKVAIAGAGAVGRSVAAELLENGHQVLLIDRSPRAIRSDTIPEADWLLADACEMSALETARLEQCDVVIAATGDDKANLVVSLLAKTEFGIGRTVARVNHPDNEWLFSGAWGVDVSVSTPRMMSALVEEAVTVGDLVRLFSLRGSNASLVELTLPEDSPYVGVRVGDVQWPRDVVLVAILRSNGIQAPEPDRSLESGDELLFVAAMDSEHALEHLLAPTEHQAVDGED
ncbi:potassium channel family protein [Mumia sp. DW29H23]|uniref:potassium channel family protein n=1 Tax=Mumia sp. DW29H23 TaxID=3421241 RepID=UPI003D687A71